MIIILLLIGAVLFALIRRGQFLNLGRLDFRAPVLILLGFAIQLLVFQKFWQENSETRAFTPLAYFVSLSVLLVALMLNRRIPGAKVLLLGFLLNFIAISLNGGYMPVSQAARVISGQHALAPGDTENNVVAMGPATRLEFLGDIFAVPKELPLPNVYSIGDVLIAVGAAYLIYTAMTNPAPRTS